MLGGIYLGRFLKLWLMVTDCCSKATWFLMVAFSDFETFRLQNAWLIEYLRSCNEICTENMKSLYLIMRFRRSRRMLMWADGQRTFPQLEGSVRWRFSHILFQCFTFLRTSKTGWMTLSNIFFCSRKKKFHVILMPCDHHGIFTPWVLWIRIRARSLRCRESQGQNPCW